MSFYGDVDAWHNQPPYVDGGGRVIGGSPHVSNIEMYVTAYDDFDESGPGASTVSTLAAGNTIGLQISVPDFDTTPGNYNSYATLSGKAATWRDASRFVDAELVASGPPGHRVRVIRDGDDSGIRARTPDAADGGLDTAAANRGKGKNKGSGKLAGQVDSWGRIKASILD